MTLKVIDLSHHNTVPQSLIPARNSGILGVIHKATEGSAYRDPKLKARYSLAKDAEMLFGVYHFVRPGDMREQADFLLATAQEAGGEASRDWLYALDYEDPAVSLPRCVEFMDQLKTRGIKAPVLYSGHVLKDEIKINGRQVELEEYRLWLAQYSTAPVMPPGWEDYWLWQYTDKGKVDGIDGNVDLNDYKFGDTRLKAEWTFGLLIPPDVDEARIVRIEIDAPPNIIIEVNGNRL